MAIGAHELLLIVRAQNQASGLLGRISRDFRRLQNMRDLDMRRSQVVNRLARNAIQQQQAQAKIASIMNENGKIRLQHQQNLNRLFAQAENIENRMAAIDIRRTAIDRARSNLEVQRLRMQRQELTIESQLEKVESRRLALNSQLGTIGVQMMRNQAAQNRNDLLEGSRGLGARAQVIERQIAEQRALSKYMSSVAKGGPVKGTLPDLRLQAATLRTQQAKAALAELTGDTNILKASMQGLRDKIVMNQKAFEDLKFVEQDLEKQHQILIERQAALEHSLANINAREKAAAATEKELRTQLALNALEVQKLDAVWAEHILTVRAVQAQTAILIDEEKMARAVLADVDAEMAAQRPEQIATMARGVSHIGRVLQLTGLVGVAAFGAMGVAAAHFNTEAVRAATQTGDINSNADVVVANSKKIEEAVTSLMQTIPANSSDMANSLYYIYSTMNATLGQGTKLLKIFGDAWVAGGMTGNIEDVSQALVTLANNWGVTADQMGQFRKLANSTLATVRFGGLTVEQYTQSMNQLAPAFHGANQSIEQMNGAIAFLTRLLPSTGVSAAGISRMMQQLQRLAAHPKEGFEGLAKAITDSTGNLKPLDKVLATIIAKEPQIVTSGVALSQFWKDATGNTGTIQAQKAFQAFVKQFDLYRTILKQTSGDQKELNRALEAFRRTAGFKWALFTTQMHAFALEIGRYVLPMLLQLASPLQKLAHWFSNLSEEQKRTYGHWAALVAAGILITGVLLSIAGALTAAIIGFRTMGTTLGPILGLTGRSSALLGTKIGLLITGFILINHLTHDWGKTLAWLFNIMAAFTLKRMITSLGIMNASMISTAGATITLRNAMIGLQAATLGEIAVIVFLAYELSKLLDKIPLVRKAGEALGHVLYRMLHPDEHDTQVTVKNLQQIREEIRKTKAEAEKHDKEPWYKKIFQFDNHDPVIKAFNNVFGLNQKNIFTPSTDILRQDIKQITAIFTAWKINHVKYSKKEKEDILLDAFPELDIHALRILMKAAARQVMVDRSMWTEKSRMANFGEIPITIATPRFTDQEMIAAARKAAVLNKAMVDASTQPDPKKYMAAWRAYNNFVKNVTKQLTKPQTKMWPDLLNFMENLPKPTKALSFIVEMDKQVNKLHDAAVKSNGDIPKWKKYAAAFELLQKIATPKQLTLADEIVQSLKAADGATRATPKMINLALSIERIQKAAELSPRSVALWDALDKAQKAFNKLGTDAQRSNAQTIAQAILAAGENAQYSTPYVLNLAKAVERLKTAAALDPTDLAKQLAAAKAEANLQKKGTPEQLGAISTVLDATPIVSQATINQLTLQRNALEKIANVAPKDSATAAWNRYFAVVDKLSVLARGHQQEIADSIGSMAQTVPQSTINRLTLQRNALQKIADAAPKSSAVAAWNRYYAVVDKLALLATGHQQEIADALASITNSIGLQAAIRLQHEIINLNKIATKSPTTANWQRYFDAVKKLAASASQEIQDQSSQIAQAQADAQAAAIQSQQDANDKAAQAAQEAYDTWRSNVIDKINQAQDDIKSASQKLLEFYQNALQTYKTQLGTIFQGPFMNSALMAARNQFGFSAGPQDFIKDIKQQVQGVEKLHGSMDTLRKRGAPQELIDQLNQLGPEGQKQIDVLMKMGPGAWKNFLAWFNRGQNDAKKYAKQETDRQLTEWLKFGKSVALQILTGLKSETPGMEDAIVNIIKNTFPGLATEAAKKPPPEKTFVGATATAASSPTTGTRGVPTGNVATKNMLGGDADPFTKSGYWPTDLSTYNKHVAQSMMPAGKSLKQAIADDRAWKRQQRGLQSAYVPTADSLRRRTQSAGGNVTNHNVTYNIHPKVEGEGMESMLRRSHFYYRNRKTNL